MRVELRFLTFFQFFSKNHWIWFVTIYSNNVRVLWHFEKKILERKDCFGMLFNSLSPIWSLAVWPSHSLDSIFSVNHWISDLDVSMLEYKFIEILIKKDFGEEGEDCIWVRYRLLHRVQSLAVWPWYGKAFIHNQFQMFNLEPLRWVWG